MKSIFDATVRNELISRINTLNENSTAQWGQMNVYQMLRHCRLCEEYYHGKFPVKRSFLGRFLGTVALKNILNAPTFQKNAPTSPKFKVNEPAGDLNTERQKWIALIEDYARFDNTSFVHFFFGKMTKEQLGQFIYKHNDHHLQQFNS